jgi:phosphoribosyl-ATP pyrophosphohydrolase/phosphoribosyl-AMP cyclohydrolase
LSREAHLVERPEELTYGDDGLLPVIVQDASSKEVLMLAYANAEAVRRTLETATTWFWSRSRAEYWNKGATSGNTQTVVAVRYDCDADALLVLVEAAGPACHTGERSCFFRRLHARGAHDG